MSEEADRWLGSAAVGRGWLTGERLADARAAQERDEAAGGSRRRLRSILVERGDLSEAQVAELVDARARGEITAEGTRVAATTRARVQGAAEAPTLRGTEPGDPALAATVRTSPAAAVDTLQARPCSSPAPPPAAAAPATVFAGRYELLATLGRGGMGVVYRARDRRIGREVALKVLLLGDRADAEDRQRFQREVRSAAALRHPGIVQILDVGEDDGKSFYTMELVEGRELQEAIRAGELSPRESIEITALIAEALAHAHAHDVLHRDIKPRNVILLRGADRARHGATPAAGEGKHWAVKLVDFGLAKFVEREVQMPASDAQGKSLRTLTHTHAMMGTPHYMSPEQTLDAGVVDGRADVYSLGASLYEMLTDRPPFHAAASLTDLLLQIKDRDPEPPRRLLPDLDPDVETICLKCLAKSARDRYATAADVAADCRRFLVGEPIAARPVGPLVRLWKRAKRNRHVAIPLAGAIVALLAVLGGLLGQEVARRVRLSDAAAAAEASFAARDYDASRKAAERAMSFAPGVPEYEDLRERALAAKAVAEAEGAWRGYRTLRDQVRERRRAIAVAASGPGWTTDTWGGADQANTADRRRRREERWSSEDALRREVIDCENAWSQAVLECGEAMSYMRDYPAARAALAELYWDKYEKAEREHDRAGEEAYRSLVESYGGAEYRLRVRCERPVRVAFVLPEGYPAGPRAAPVLAWLFRYERHAQPPVLVPVPCHPVTGEGLASPRLEEAWEPVPVAVGEKLPASAISDARAAAPEAAVVRAARWGSVYPLECGAENRILLSPTAGSSRPTAQLDLRLPRGSYLLYFPGGQGLHEVRYPFQVARDLDWSAVTCELPAEDAAPPLPPGMEPPPAQPISPGAAASRYWAYLPAGAYRASGDRDTVQFKSREAALLRVAGDGEPGSPLPLPSAAVPSPSGIFVARFEATVGMYLQYLNDRAWQSSKEAKEAPALRRPYACEDEQGRFHLEVPGWEVRDDWPLFVISWDEARDYARWLTARQSGWSFDLPTEDEWEKAARGPDGRFFPWGDDVHSTFCHMLETRVAEKEGERPEPVALFPLDEGPYGVRDLAGSLQEWTSTVTGAQGSSDPQWRIVKGGGIGRPGMAVRAAGRNASPHGSTGIGLGFRLCARRVR